MAPPRSGTSTTPPRRRRRRHLDNPFNSLADVSGASGPDAAGDIIYVATGSGDYTGGITLLDNQILWGAGEALVVNGVTLAAAGTDPVIANAAGNGVTVEQGNTLKGFTVGNTTGFDIANTAGRDRRHADDQQRHAERLGRPDPRR